MVRLAQKVHLSCTDTTTVSKWIEVRFHIINVTLEIHSVCPKQFLTLCYVWRKPCIYLASRFALSPNRPKRASTWASSPRSTIGCIQNNFYAYGSFGANRAPILHWQYHCLQMDWNEIPRYQCHQGDPSGVSKTISEPTVHLAQTVLLYCIKVSTISNTHQNEHPLEPCHLGVPSCASKIISERCLMQTMHLSCSNTTTVSKWIEMRFHMTNVTLEIRRVRPNYFWAYGTFCANRAPILRQN
jgi:hypothetical protein